MLTHSFEDLSQTYRILAESHLKLNQLICIDRPEAVGTIETAINAKLNAFHNLYDLMIQELGNPVDWYDTPELCTILAVRNARHHNIAKRIRSIWNYHNQESRSPTETKRYLYVNFPSADKDDGGNFFDIPLSWSDIDLLLNMPRSQSRIRSTAKELIRNYLNADSYEAEAGTVGLTKHEVFINFVPLFLNAGISLYPYIKDHVQPNSVESKFFLSYWEIMGPADTQNYEQKEISFCLPN